MTTGATAYKSPLHEMTQTTCTCLWNDSASLQELGYAIDHGAVGATCNPVIVVDVLKSEMHLWKERIQELIRSMPTATEHDIAWTVVDEMSSKGAALVEADLRRTQRAERPTLRPDGPAILSRRRRHCASGGASARSSRPTSSSRFRSRPPASRAIEEATYRGISINATVCFSLPQCVAVAEAVERGLDRREQEGKDIATMGPVCTIMVGRLDDWLKVVADKQDISVDPGVLEWAGLAVFKKTYGCSRSAAIASGCCQQPSATTCTGASSSAATS